MILRDLLLIDPPRTWFFNAVMLLERLTSDQPRIGSDAPRAEEALSFRHSISFSFQPNDISSICWVEVIQDAETRLDGRRGRYEITTCVLGLTGADSPLPLYHVEDLVLESDSDLIQAAFLDMFHNRLTALLYRARSKYSPSREFLRGARDPLSTRLLAAVGIDRGGAGEPTQPPRSHLLGIAALLATGGSTGRSIENALRGLMARDLEETPLILKQLTGSWIEFDPDQRNSLGKRNSEMAVNWVLGTRVRHPAHRARVVVGPLPPTRARHFSPGGDGFERMNDLVQALCAEPVAVDVELLIDQDAYPPFFLRAKGARVLGENVFLSSRKRAGRLMRRVYSLDDVKEKPPGPTINRGTPVKDPR
ncbi:MAG: type VI secretion system baseplate subunit TssG [Myxococcales bacterium]|nr:type VI secretion system baseplate subunit TssG [Myxococcales bacterium]